MEFITGLDLETHSRISSSVSELYCNVLDTLFLAELRFYKTKFIQHFSLMIFTFMVFLVHTYCERLG